jgi:predicted Zn finger-like uncharacterized protein
MDKIETECPECGSKLRFTLADLAAQRTVRCGRGHAVKLEDQGGEARKADKALKDLERTLKNFGR